LQVSLYGLSVKIPREWRVKIADRTSYESGGFSLVSPTAGDINVIWAQLDQFKRQYPTPEAYFETQFKQLEEDAKKKRILDLSIDKRPWLLIPDHKALLYKVTYTTKPILGREVHRKVLGLGVYCEKSNRFIIIYNESSDEKNQKPMPDDVILSVMESFRCLCDED